MPKYKVFAAIEIGSTRISMKIAEISKSKIISVLDNVKYELPIGKETFARGKINYENVDKICSCLEKFTDIMKGYSVDDYSCYATTALREASNSEYIIEQINIRTGLKVSIISNEEERFLHNKAIALETGYFDDIIETGAVLVDVSSGSVQISCYRNSELKFSQNISIGSLRLLENLSGLRDEAVSFYELMLKYIESEIRKINAYFPLDSKYEYAVFFGNQAENIKKICGISGKDIITYAEFENTYKKIANKSFDDISYEFDIKYDDVGPVVSTYLIFKSFMNMKKDLKMIISEITLEDGMCVEYVEKNGYTHTKHLFTGDIISSAMYCAQKYSSDINHIKKIIEFNNQIFKALSKRYNLSKNDNLLLTVASIFSDTGKYISINDYKKYSCSIVKAAPLIGLSKNDMDVIAGIIDEEGTVNLTKRRRLLVSKLSSILYMSKSLDTEYRQNITSIKATLKNNELLISAETYGNALFEKYKFEEEKMKFEDVFGITAKIKIIRKR